MKHDVRACKNPIQKRRVEDVALDDGQLSGQVLQILAFPGGEIIQHRNVIAPRDEGACES